MRLSRAEHAEARSCGESIRERLSKVGLTLAHDDSTAFTEKIERDPASLEFLLKTMRTLDALIVKAMK